MPCSGTEDPHSRNNLPFGGGQVPNKRFVPIILVTVALALVAVLGYALPDGKAESEKPKRVAMQNTGGPVVFEHARHEEWVKSCADCHHDMAAGVKKPLACNTCHGVTVDEAFVSSHEKKFDRAACIVCHHYVPGTRDWGHDMHVKEFGLECSSCHHEDTSIEPEPMNCADCHEAGKAPSKAPFEEGVPPGLADSVHKRCASCHQEWFDTGARSCVKCHFDKPLEGEKSQPRRHANMETMTCSSCHATEVAKLIPSGMKAHHGSCMGCHAEVGRGPRTQQDCARCHLK